MVSHNPFIYLQSLFFSFCHSDWIILYFLFSRSLFFFSVSSLLLKLPIQLFGSIIVFSTSGIPICLNCFYYFVKFLTFFLLIFKISYSFLFVYSCGCLNFFKRIILNYLSDILQTFNFSGSIAGVFWFLLMMPYIPEFLQTLCLYVDPCIFEEKVICLSFCRCFLVVLDLNCFYLKLICWPVVSSHSGDYLQ